MTTQAEVTHSNEVVHVPLQINNPVVSLVLVALLILALITTAFWVTLPKQEDFSGINSGLSAMSARYQGLADFYTGKNESVSQRALEAISARYQGLADNHAVQLGRSRSATAERYQSMADILNGAGPDQRRF